MDGEAGRGWVDGFCVRLLETFVSSRLVRGRTWKATGDYESHVSGPRVPRKSGRVFDGALRSEVGSRACRGRGRKRVLRGNRR